MNSNYVHVGIVGNTKKICVSKQYNSKFYIHTPVLFLLSPKIFLEGQEYIEAC